MATSTFRGIIEFFDKIGIYDVVLPFLLVFTVVFAILEKTKLFGTEDVGGTKYTKKNLNAMMSFVVAFLVIASTKLVAIINQALGNVVIFLIIILSFLLLIGSFFSEDEKVFLEKGPWRTTFMIATLVGIILIFLAAIPMDSGGSWLEWFWDWMNDHWQNDWVAAIIFIIVIIIFIALITRGGGGKKKEEKKE
ncbi:MAG: hypothetical protein Q7J54_00710 [Candidatus Woesearchaeota archaeon]|nr:hypothetical protein [Candidatus Woesearchaeota archaeon]